MRMPCIAIIPARGGSKRIPHKNLYPFEGIPMIAHAIRIARTAGCFHEVLVSTDCPEIAAVARRLGVSVPFMRSEAASNDYATTFDVIDEVLDQLEANGQVWNIGVCLYPTAVLARAQDIAQAVSQIARGEADSLMPVSKFESTIWRSFQLKSDGTPFYSFPQYINSRSQDLVSTYHDAGQWYAFKISALRATGQFIGCRTRVVVLPSEHVQDIDTLSDLRLAELKYRARRETRENEDVRDRPWVLIRVDATPETGSGHVMRCLALAEAFAARNHDALFISRECVPELREAIEKRGFQSLILEPRTPFENPLSEGLADAAATLALINDQIIRPSWVVVDHYGLDATWENAVRCCGAPLLAVDDLADRPHACDALLDQNMIKDNHARYPLLVPEGTRLLLGGAYSLLRSEFAQAYERRMALLQESALQDIILFMGGTDAGKLTLPLANGLITYFGSENVLVLIGYLNGNRETIENWCRVNSVRCKVCLDDVSSAFSTCRLLVAACGMTAVEAQALGIPCLLVALSNIQYAVAQWFSMYQRAILLELDQCQDPDALTSAIDRALDLDQSKDCESLISVYGATRAVDALIEIGQGLQSFSVAT